MVVKPVDHMKEPTGHTWSCKSRYCQQRMSFACLQVNRVCDFVRNVPVSFSFLQPCFFPTMGLSFHQGPGVSRPPQPIHRAPRNSIWHTANRPGHLPPASKRGRSCRSERHARIYRAFCRRQTSSSVSTRLATRASTQLSVDGHRRWDQLVAGLVFPGRDGVQHRAQPRAVVEKVLPDDVNVVVPCVGVAVIVN